MSVKLGPPSKEDRVQCSACGFWVNPKTTASGGRFSPVTSTATQNGQTVYYEGNTDWCPFCHSPEWTGAGDLGDMAR